MDAVRSVEERIEFAMKPIPARKPNRRLSWRRAGPRDPARFPGACPADAGPMVLAFRFDAQTFMFANDVSTELHFVEGVNAGHHDLSHHENKEDKIEQYRRVNRWHTAQFAYLLEKMRAIPEGEGNLLDNSMILFGSSISDGNRHDPNNLPILVAGKAGGAFRTGQHIASEKNTPLCNLYQTMLGGMGVEVERFGDSTGVMKEVIA